MKTKNIILIPLFFLALIVTPQYSAPNFDDIVLKGDRNLKIINMIYEKYPFMPAKKNYYAQIEQSWIKSKAEYFTSSSQNRKEKFTQFLKTYETTNEVLKDICIDMANYSDVITDDITQKLIETGTKQISVRHGKFYNRYVVSKNEFSRAEDSYKKKMYYYSARLYDHGIEVIMSIYKDAGWNFPKSKAAPAKEILS